MKRELNDNIRKIVLAMIKCCIIRISLVGQPQPFNFLGKKNFDAVIYYNDSQRNTLFLNDIGKQIVNTLIRITLKIQIMIGFLKLEVCIYTYYFQNLIFIKSCISTEMKN